MASKFVVIPPHLSNLPIHSSTTSKTIRYYFSISFLCEHQTRKPILPFSIKRSYVESLHRSPNTFFFHSVFSLCHAAFAQRADIYRKKVFFRRADAPPDALVACVLTFVKIRPRTMATRRRTLELSHGSLVVRLKQQAMERSRQIMRMNSHRVEPWTHAVRSLSYFTIFVLPMYVYTQVNKTFA